MEIDWVVQGKKNDENKFFLFILESMELRICVGMSRERKIDRGELHIQWKR